jgi:hypothetical protein
MSNYTLAQLQRISSLIQRDTLIFLTSANWGRLAAELDADTLTDKGNKPTPQNFKRLNLRAKQILTAVNSGSDDEAALDGLNRIAEEYSGYVWARDKFAVPAKAEPFEWTDAESTWEVPDDLRREIEDRSTKAHGRN